MEIKANYPYQHEFLISKKRYPAIISGIGTGKTLMMLLKIYKYCELYPDSLALIVRKEFTDLRDSTLKDFNTYFGSGVNTDKEYHFPNGSVIMFRHGGELSATNRANVLKNINLSIFGIEQAEEFDTEEIFTFLRDRLRRQNAPYRQGIIIANANGHNWCWRLWKNNPGVEFDLQEATTFDNAHNLPRDFIEDLRRMAQDAPNHYRRYVMNSHEEVESDDTLFTFDKLHRAIGLEMPVVGIPKKILGIDISRYGSAETVFTMLKSRGVMRWAQTYLERWRPGEFKENRLMQIVGKTIELKYRLMPDIIALDDDGLGGGVTDRLGELKIGVPIVPFHAGVDAVRKEMYANYRTEAAFILQDLVDSSYIKLYDDPETIDQLMTLKFLYQSDKRKMLVPKEVMRKQGIKSPDRADALIIAVSLTKRAFEIIQQNQNQNLPRVAVMDSPFAVPTTQGFERLARSASMNTEV